MMDPDIEDCIELLHEEYDGGSDMSIVFSPQWRKILQNERIALWGKSEEETVKLGLPSYKQFLFRLAEQGLGYLGIKMAFDPTSLSFFAVGHSTLFQAVSLDSDTTTENSDL
jgi:hypothetical protein